MSRKDYNIEQRSREENKQLNREGPVEEEVRVMEYRDLWINTETEIRVVDEESSGEESDEYNRSICLEDSSDEESDGSVYKHNISTCSKSSSGEELDESTDEVNISTCSEDSYKNSNINKEVNKSLEEGRDQQENEEIEK